MKNLLLLLFSLALSFLSIGMSVEMKKNDISWKYSHDAIMYHDKDVSVTPIVKVRGRIHSFKNNLIDSNIDYKKMLSTKTLSKNKKFNNTTFFSCYNIE